MAAQGAPRRVADRWAGLAQRSPAVGVVDTLLRGVGQVMFQNNPLTGLLFLVGILVNSAKFCGAGLLGLAASTLAAYLLLGSAPIEGRISGIVDIPNACASLYLPTAIFDFDIRPTAEGPRKADRGQCAVTS